MGRNIIIFSEAPAKEEASPPRWYPGAPSQIVGRSKQCRDNRDKTAKAGLNRSRVICRPAVPRPTASPTFRVRGASRA